MSAAVPTGRVAIIGGGYAGASAAVQLVRRSAAPLAITLIDPAPRPGRGLAYGSADSDHRLNAPTFIHTLLPDDAGHFSRWCAQQRLDESDPQARGPAGTWFMRRGDFGRYIEDTLVAHSAGAANGCHIRSRCDSAVALERGRPAQAAWMVHTASGAAFAADQVLLATGHPKPQLPPPFDTELATHPAVLAQPLHQPRLPDIAPSAPVLVLGTGLSALDVISTLLRRGHRGAITALSRRGLRPLPQGPVPAALAEASLQALGAIPSQALLDRVAVPPPAFLQAPGTPPQVRLWLRALRAQVAQAEAAGDTWHGPFDAMRDTLWQLWPQLPAAERQRFWRRLRPWYDVHRYRSPPQNQAMVDEAVAAGRVRFVAARLLAARTAAGGLGVSWQPAVGSPCAEVFGAVINCTGMDAAAGLASNPLLAQLHAQGWIRRDPSGVGFEVDAQCCAVGADGRADERLRLVGPPTVGTAGDPIGALYIAAQIHRMLPGLLASLSASSTG